MDFSTRNYDKLLIPGLFVSLGLHMFLFFLPGRLFQENSSSSPHSSPILCFETLPPDEETAPAVQKKIARNYSLRTDKIIAPPPPRPRLNDINPDSSGLFGVSLAGIADFTPEYASGSAPSLSGGLEPDSAASISSYISEVFARISQARQYPEASRRLGQKGVVEVGFAINRDGNLSGEARLMNPSPYDLLNRAACRSILRSAPFAPLPECVRQVPLPLKVKILYELKE